MDGRFVLSLTMEPEVKREVNKITNLPTDTHLMKGRPENC